MMSTRPGDLDPGLLLYLQCKEGLSIAELETLLNQKSGMLGVSGRSADMRELVAAAPHDPQAALAAEVFSYRVRITNHPPARIRRDAARIQAGAIPVDEAAAECLTRTTLSS
jgi:acetate kinase